MKFTALSSSTLFSWSHLRMRQVCISLLLLFSMSQAKLKVGASIPDLASIAAAIGGDEVEVFSIAKAKSNPHFVEMLPSYMVKVSHADLYLKVGLGLDPWADGILDGSHNTHVKIVECSNGIQVLDKPTGKVDASLGDVHSQGNPHYWLDPENGIRIAQTLFQALVELNPKHAEAFKQNLDHFQKQITEAKTKWLQSLAFMQGKAIITYHSSWAYWAHVIGVRVIGFVEPFPGIPPTAKHLNGLIESAKRQNAMVLIAEPYYPDKDAQFLGREIGIPVLKFTPSCEGVQSEDYLRHFDMIVKAMADLSKG